MDKKTFKFFVLMFAFVSVITLMTGAFLQYNSDRISVLENKIVSIETKASEMSRDIKRNDRNFQAQMETDYVVARWKHELQQHLDDEDDERYSVSSIEASEGEGIISAVFQYCNFVCTEYRISEKYDVTGNSTVVIEKL